MTQVGELVLARVWHAQWLADRLRTTDGRPLRVVYRGVWTHGAGPDFTGALLDLDGTLVRGDVEVHVRAAGWYEHGHHRDPAYNGVVLHAVLDPDPGRPARRQDGVVVATLALRPYLLGPIEQFNPGPALRPLGAIGFAHCAPAVAATRPDALVRVWEAAGDERLAGKVASISQALSTAPPAQVLYARLLDALGYSRNREGMGAVAARLPYDHLEARLVGRSPRERWERAAGLLLGVGGFLPLSPREAALADIDPATAVAIERQWQRLGGPWHDARLPPTVWTLARQRPAAHPLRRLLALAVLLARLDAGLVGDLTAVCLDPDPHRALRCWLTDANPYLGASHAHEIIVNVVVPFLLAYGDQTGDDRLSAAAADLWDRLPAGAGNALVRKTVEQICGPHRVPVRSARAEQGLLHLQRTGCAPMRCYECPVAHLALAEEG